MWKPSEGETVDRSVFSYQIHNPSLECIDEAKAVFRLKGQNTEGTVVNTKVEPVLFGGNWRKARARFQAKLSSYTQAVEERKKEAERVNKMGDLRRNLSISNFGIYNCDRLYKVKKAVSFKPLFFIPLIQKSCK